ncbi:PREDICTED: transcription initiation factor TFIID subunit 4-like [Capra hircus]|uniref:transcription initiation factor TFIID subunit 4-like n=1 Tax=Capra hircus TaxID=9925 RepID=UPI0008467FB1|nr:PREDICTED: transcription initiation factor TFIID subunit 4-like [Capra hircus]
MTQFAIAVRGRALLEEAVAPSREANRYPEGQERPGKERKQLLNQTSSSGFGNRESEASREGSATPRRRARGAPASPGRRSAARAQAPDQPRPRGAPSSPCPRQAAARPPPEPGSDDRSAETGRPEAARAAPAPRNAGPGPGGRRGRARRGAPGWGPRVPSRLPLSPSSALRDEPPATPQSQRKDSGGWAPLALPLLPERPLPRIDRAATGPAAGKVLWEPQPPPPPPPPGRGVVSLTQEEPLKQPPPF